MRLVVSNLEQFRRAASYISNALIIAAISGWALSQFFPWQHPLSEISASLYLGLAVVAKFITRNGRTMSARTVRLLEIVGTTGLLFGVLVEVYQAVRGGIHDIGLVGHTFNILILVTIGFIFKKNVFAAKSMASRI